MLSEDIFFSIMVGLWFCALFDVIGATIFIPFVYRFGISFQKIQSNISQPRNLSKLDKIGSTKSAKYKFTTENTIIFRGKYNAISKTPLMFKGIYIQNGNDIKIILRANIFTILFLTCFPIWLTIGLINAIWSGEIVIWKFVLYVLVMGFFVWMFLSSYNTEKKQIVKIVEELNEKLDNLVLK